MNKQNRHLQTVVLATVVTAAAFMGAANANTGDSSIKLLTARFEPRRVVQVEIGDFHFTPGQVAPIHTHAAPAVGYVAKGQIIYQVEGEKQQILNAGDVFYEPVGPRILRFDNASATEEAIFLDFNLEQADEPFIVFEQAPTEAIDRRSLPTIDLVDRSVDRVDIYSSELEHSGSIVLAGDEPSLGLVTEGVVELQIDGEAKQRIAAGGSFSLPGADSSAMIVNVSSEVIARILPMMAEWQGTGPFMTEVAVTEEKFGSVPKTFIRTTIDQMISPALQDNMINNWEVDSVFELVSGHFPTSSMPGELAEVLLAAAAINSSKLVSNA